MTDPTPTAPKDTRLTRKVPALDQLLPRGQRVCGDDQQGFRLVLLKIQSRLGARARPEGRSTNLK
jgi:hypothetical protein